MMGLFSAPAVMRAPVLASAAVRSTVAVGQRFDRTSRVTCSDASAVRRATEIWGLFLRASACAFFRESTIGVPGLFCGAPFCEAAIGALEGAGVVACWGIGAAGKLEDAPRAGARCARVNVDIASATHIESRVFIAPPRALDSRHPWLRACRRPANKPRAR